MAVSHIWGRAKTQQGIWLGDRAVVQDCFQESRQVTWVPISAQAALTALLACISVVLRSETEVWSADLPVQEVEIPYY